MMNAGKKITARPGLSVFFAAAGWKRFVECAVLLVGVFAAGAVFGANDRISVALSTSSPVLNEPFQIEVTVVGSGGPELVDPPALEGARWMPNISSRQTALVNGERRETRGFAILPLKKGKLTIPELKIRVNGTVYPLKSFSVEVRERRVAAAGAGGDAVDVALSDAVRGEVKIGSARTTFYVGESIPVEYVLNLLRGLPVRRLSYPEVKLDKAVFADYRDVNPDHPRFQRSVRGDEVTIDGRDYETLIFRTVCRPIAPGVLTLTGESQVGVLDRANRRGGGFDDDPFLGGFFSSNRIVPLAVDYRPSPALTVKPLPPPEGNFTNLVGRFQLQYTLDKKQEKAGGLLTFVCRISGFGADSETLRAPELKLPGFRVYPPEVRRDGVDAATISYALIPLQAGSVPLKLSLSTFDPETGRYCEFPFSETLTVEPSDNPPGTVSGAAAETPGTVVASPNARDSAAPVEFRRLKTDLSDRVRLPLWDNVALFAVLLFLAGPLLLFAAEFRRRRRERLNADPELCRRLAARGRRGELAAKIRCAPDTETLLELANNDLCELAADLRGLPRGSGAADVADVLSDSGAAELLRRAGAARFSRDHAAFDRETLRRGLLKLLNKALLILLVCGVESSLAAGDGNAAFEKGDNRAAVALFQRDLAAHPGSPALLYNLGCAYSAANEAPRALRALTEAHLLDPWDADTLDELNEVRGKLLLSPLGKVDSPASLLVQLRDRLRPDQWLAVFAVCWFLGFAVAAFRRVFGRDVAWSLIAVAALAGAIALGVAATQMRGPYNPDNGVVVAERTELRTLPTASGGEVEATLSGGTEVRILEERDAFTLVSGGGKTGWVRRGSVEKILPAGLF